MPGGFGDDIFGSRGKLIKTFDAEGGFRVLRV